MSKVLSIAAAMCVVLLVFVGCGGSSSTKSASTSAASVSSQAAAVASESSPSTEASPEAASSASSAAVTAAEVSHDGEAKPPLSRKDVSKRNYKDVVTLFENAGFTNVQTEGKGDLKTGFLHDEGDVDEVSINGEVKYDADAWYPLDAKIVVRYHSYPESKESASKQDGGNAATTQSTNDSIPKEYKTALKKAESYSNLMHMSKAGIYDQLTSEYGEKYSAEAAQYAVDNMKADWNANALAKAKSYQDTMDMSPAAIYDQLVSEYGEKFTPEEAQYAVDNL